MKKYFGIKVTLTAYVLIFLFISIAHSADTPTINEHLKPLLPFVGKTWKGELKDPSSGMTGYDISKWELVLNGQAIRVLHSVNDGIYGGETIIIWDNDKQQLLSFYFTTAGFYTQGTISFKDGKIISHEKVNDNQNGITEVKAVAEVTPDGKLQSKSQYLKNGEWIAGHEIIYVEDPTAEVKSK